MPPGQTGPVAVCAGGADLFFVANAVTRNLSLVRVGSGQPVFDPPLDPALPPESGAPVAVAASLREEVVVLFDRDLVLFHGPRRITTVPKFPILFADKVNGQPGVALALQP